MITSTVAKITFVVVAILSGCNHFFSGQDHLRSGLDIFLNDFGHFFGGQDHFVVA